MNQYLQQKSLSTAPKTILFGAIFLSFLILFLASFNPKKKASSRLLQISQCFLALTKNFHITNNQTIVELIFAQ
jgi:hypothetical protein